MSTSHLQGGAPAGHRPARFAAANEAKASFDLTYNAPGPAAYFKALLPLDYRIPDEARAPVRELIDSLRNAAGKRQFTVLDVGCSYGINAAVLKYSTNFRAIAERCAGLNEGERLAQKDRAFFESLPRDESLRVVGLDVAENAVAYGIQSGLLDDGFVANLEEKPLNSEQREKLQKVDLIVSTGCVGYVTDKTFGRLVDAVAGGGRVPVVASFVLRMFRYDAIARALASNGLRTDKSQGTFRQRRFRHDRERSEVLSTLEQMGLEPQALEASDGYLHAELFVSELQESRKP